MAYSNVAHDLSFDADGLVQLDCELRVDGLARVLQNMAFSIQHFQRKTAELNDELYQLRRQHKELAEKVRDGMVQEEANRQRIREQQEKMVAELAHMATSYVTVQDFDARLKGIQGTLQGFSDSLRVIESSGGQKIMKHIESFVGRHVVEWYDGIHREEEKDFLQRLAALQSDIEGRMRSEMGVQRDQLHKRTTEVADTASCDLKERIAEKEKQVQSILKTRENDMAQVASKIQGVDDWHRRAEAEAAQKAHDRFVEVETRAAALFHTLCLDEGECRELLEDQQKREKMVDRQTLQMDGDEMIDRRVDVMHNTKPYLELRAKIQRDIRSRIMQNKEEDQDDFSRQISEVQRELKSKVNVQRVTEIVHESTDRTLYDSVDLVKAKVQAMEIDKVNQDIFQEALRSKSDTKQLEAKADRAFVTQLFEFLRGKVEQLVESQSKDIDAAVDQAFGSRQQLTRRPQADAMGLQRVGSNAQMGGGTQNIMIGSPIQPTGDSPQRNTAERERDQSLINAALNPQPDYAWGSQQHQRQGMPPNRSLKSVADRFRYDQQRGIDGRSAPGRPQQHQQSVKERLMAPMQARRQGSASSARLQQQQQHGGVASPDARTEEVAQWVVSIDQPAAAEVTADDLPTLGGGGGGGGQRAVASRGQEAYARAVSSAQPARPGGGRLHAPGVPSAAAAPAPPSTAPTGAGRRPQQYHH